MVAPGNSRQNDTHPRRFDVGVCGEDKARVHVAARYISQRLPNVLAAHHLGLHGRALGLQHRGRPGDDNRFLEGADAELRVDADRRPL